MQGYVQKIASLESLGTSSKFLLPLISNMKMEILWNCDKN